MKSSFTSLLERIDPRRLIVSLCMLVACASSGFAAALPVTPQVAAGGAHTLYVQSDGTLWSWGYGEYGQLGTGTLDDQFSPVQIGLERTWEKVAAGGSSSFAIATDGSLWSWGRNTSGELGHGSTSTEPRPRRVGTGNDWLQISAGVYHAVAIKKDGTLWAWGENAQYQLGDGTNTDHGEPVRIGVDNDWIAVAAGGWHTLGLKRNGTLWAWGDNGYGQLGAPGTTAGPRQVGADLSWRMIAAGVEYSAALRQDGTLWTWGNNSRGQLGDGTTVARTLPMQIGGADWEALGAGAQHLLVIKSNGTLWSWGSNGKGELGDGTNVDRSVPSQIGNAANWTHVTASAHSVALTQNGSLFAWGANIVGQVGDGVGYTQSTPRQIGTEATWVEAKAGGDFSIARKSPGTLWAWGENHDGEVGDGTNTPRPAPIQIGSATDWAQLSSEYSHSVGLKTGGSLWTWGQDLPPPTQLGAATNWGVISANFRYGVAAIKADGTLWVDDRPATEPSQVGRDSDWKSVSVGGGIYGNVNHIVALKNNGTLWAWGRNVFGQLGNGTTTDEPQPVQIATASNWASVSAGDGFTVARKSDGTLWAWGRNTYGQLGEGTTNVQWSPKKIGAATDWGAMAAGVDHALALKTNGELWAWGRNDWGQLGDQTRVDKHTPVRVGTDIDWASVDAGYVHTLAVKTNGTLFGWGGNEWFQIAIPHPWSPKSIYSPPVVTSFPELTTFDSALYQFALTAADVDGDSVTFGTNTLPSWLTFNPSTGVLTGTPAQTDLGAHQVALTVNDGHYTKVLVFTVTVTRNPRHDQMLWLAFNEGSGAQSFDDSFTGVSAMLSGTQWMPSFEGQSLRFNAAAYGVVPDLAVLDFSTAMTLEAWIHPTANNQNAYLIAKNYDITNQFAYGLGLRSGALHATLNNVIYKSNYVVPRNKWTHVATSWNGSTLKLFANGTQVFSALVTGPLLTNTQRLLIGARNANGTGFAEGFVGGIDGVQLWKIALSPQALCLEAGRTWSGSACTGEVFNNSTPTANSATFSTTLGKVLNGTLSATNPDSDPLTFLLGTGPTKGTVQITNPSTGAFRYVPSATGADSFTFRVTDYFGISGLATVNVNVTSGAALDSDGDGMKDVIEAQHGLNPASPADGPQDKDHDTLSNYNEVIANRNPTIPFETDALHVLGMSFREGAGTAPRDATNAANHGTFNGTKAKWSAGPFGNAFSTTATSGVTISDKASLDITGAFSVELWVKPSTSNQTSYLVAKNSDTGAGTFDYGLGLSGGKLRAVLTGNTYTSGYIVPVNEWTHVALTWDAAKVRIYANGNVIYTVNRTKVLTANAKPLVIGARNTPAGALTQGFTGELDQVNVWRRALNGSEVCTASGGVLNGAVCVY